MDLVITCAFVAAYPVAGAETELDECIGLIWSDSVNVRAQWVRLVVENVKRFGRFCDVPVRSENIS
jgi:hypothetical protein